MTNYRQMRHMLRCSHLPSQGPQPVEHNVQFKFINPGNHMFNPCCHTFLSKLSMEMPLFWLSGGLVRQPSLNRAALIRTMGGRDEH